MGALAGAEAPAGTSCREHEVPGGEVDEPDVAAVGPHAARGLRPGSLDSTPAARGPRPARPRATVSAGGRPWEAMTDEPLDVEHRAPRGVELGAHPCRQGAEHAVRGALLQDDERGGVGLETAVMASSGHGPHVLQRHAVDLGDLAEQERQVVLVGELDDELVDGLALAVLDDLDRDQVAAHRPDPAGDRPERARPVGQLHPEQEGRHAPRLRAAT